MAKLRTLVLLVVLVALAIPAQFVTAAGDERQTADFPLDALNSASAIELRGLVDSQTLHFQLPQSWSLQGDSALTLRIRASELLDPERSSLSITLNDKSVRSFEVPRSNDETMHMTFPGSLLRPGSNKLSFTAVLYLGSDRATNCANWEDPARWLTVDPGGTLHIAFVRRNYPIDLSNLSQLLVDPLERYVTSGAARPPLIVLPDQPKRDDLSTVTSLAYALGAGSDSSTAWSPQVISESQFNSQTAASRNLILVNVRPEGLKTQAEAGKSFLAIEPSPWDTYHVAMLVGDTDRADGFTPVSAIADPARAVQLHGQIAYLDKAAPVAAPAFQDTLTFEDLGYQDRTVRGVGRLDLIYRLFLPYDIKPVISRLVLSVAHSPNLDSQNSPIMVYLNGAHVAGILPTASQGTAGAVEVDLGPTKFRTGENFLRISLVLRLAHPTCNSSIESAWATVFSSSRLEFTVRHQAPLASLSYFPAPFSDYPGFTFVVPHSVQPNDLGQMAQLSFAMGTAARFPQLPPDAITADEFNPATARRNLIMVGMPAENAAIGRVNSLLPQPFLQGQNRLAGGYGVYLPDGNQAASLGLAEIIPSPWANGGAVLVLSGNDAQGMEWTWAKVRDPEQWSGFDGNLMLVGAGQRSNSASTGGAAPSAYFQQTAEVSQIPVIGPLLQAAGRSAPGPAILIVLAALVLVLAAVAAIHFILDKRARAATQGKEAADD